MVRNENKSVVATALVRLLCRRGRRVRSRHTSDVAAALMQEFSNDDRPRADSDNPRTSKYYLPTCISSRGGNGALLRYGEAIRIDP